MKFRYLSALVAFAVAASATASPVKVPVVQTGSGYQPAQGSVEIDSAGNDATDTTNHALRVNVVSSAVTTASARHFPGCTVGTSSGTCLAASTAVTFLQIQDTSPTATIACAFGASAVLNSTNSFQLAPGQSASWGPSTGGVPTGSLNCIASAASTSLYVEWN